MRESHDLTQADVLERLDYDEHTGILRWKERPHNSYKGKVAGTPQPHGYLYIRMLGKNYSAHRIIWLLVHGAWPNSEIDHKNGVRDDNRLSNLRNATSQNQRANMSLRHDNKWGAKGIRRPRNGAKWTARVMIDRVEHHLGTFLTKEEAVAAYDTAAKAAFGEFAKTKGIIYLTTSRENSDA